MTPQNGYACLYVHGLGKVCVTTVDTSPARMYYYTRRELEEQIQDSPEWDFRLDIYRTALEQFPTSAVNYLVGK